MAPIFERYAGGDSADRGIAMPVCELDARVSTLTISELLGRLEVFTNGQEGPERYPWATRFVMGLPLPSWQRPFVWTAEQCERFIQSIWTGVDIGTYMVNDIWQFQSLGTNTPTFRENSMIVLDGQQRLTALEGYVTGKFAVADASGTPRFWPEIPVRERRRFANTHFARGTVSSWDETLLRRAYDLRAFGGTAHTEDQRASS